jgi:hypothetical protein
MFVRSVALGGFLESGTLPRATEGYLISERPWTIQVGGPLRRMPTPRKVWIPIKRQDLSDDDLMLMALAIVMAIEEG